VGYGRGYTGTYSGNAETAKPQPKVARAAFLPDSALARSGADGAVGLAAPRIGQYRRHRGSRCAGIGPSTSPGSAPTGRQRARRRGCHLRCQALVSGDGRLRRGPCLSGAVRTIGARREPWRDRLQRSLPL